MQTKREPMSPVHAERLLMLANFLEKEVKEDRFNFNTWSSSAGLRDYINEAVTAKSEFIPVPEGACGTTACALGWATTIPAFRDLGLRLFVNRWGEVWPGMVDDKTDDSTWTNIINACNRLFGLTPDETNYLFTPGIAGDDDLSEDLTNDDKPPSDAMKVEVADHIRAFVKVRTRNTL